MGKTNPKALSRTRRKRSIRKKLHGTSTRPRLSVFRSAKHIYAQLVDDDSAHTLVAASSLEQGLSDDFSHGGNVKAAKAIGKLLGTRAREAGIESVVFDRNGFLYHGRVKALADAARQAGLKF